MNRRGECGRSKGEESDTTFDHRAEDSKGIHDRLREADSWGFKKQTGWRIAARRARQSEHWETSSR